MKVLVSGVSCAAFLAVLLIVAPCAAQMVTLDVVILGNDLEPKPVPMTEFLVLQDEKVLKKTVTDRNGHAELDLSPGEYIVKSASETKYAGIAYEWNLPFSVLEGIGTQLVLTDANAQSRSHSPQPGRRQSEGSVIFESVQSGVFTIYGVQGRGSGFLVDPRGLVLTNAHVIEGSLPDEVRVQVTDTTKVAARIMGVDDERDVAVLLMNMEHCFGCALLELAEADGGIPIVRVGEEVLAIGSPLNQTQILTAGIVSKVESGAILSDVNINPGNSGGPLLTLDARVVGINTFHDPSLGGPGVSGSILVTEAVDVLRDATNQLDAMGINPVSPALLPTPPGRAFPIELLEQAASQGDYDLDPYRTDAGPFEILIMTPPVMAWRNAEELREITERRAEREAEAEAGEEERIDPIHAWYAWDQYVGERAAVVVFNVIPDVGQTKGSIFRGILSGLAAGLTGNYYPAKSTLEFKGDFRRMRLLRDGLEIVPVEFNRSPAVLNIDTYLTEGKDYAYQGVYVYRPEQFEPNSDGTFSDYTLVIEDLKNPDEERYVALDEETLDAIWNDFRDYVGYE